MDAGDTVSHGGVLSRRRKIFESVVVLVFAVLLVAMMYVFLQPWLDTKGQQWVQCDVVDVLDMSQRNSVALWGGASTGSVIGGGVDTLQQIVPDPE